MSARCSACTQRCVSWPPTPSLCFVTCAAIVTWTLSPSKAHSRQNSPSLKQALREVSWQVSPAKPSSHTHTPLSQLPRPLQAVGQGSPAVVHAILATLANESPTALVAMMRICSGDTGVLVRVMWEGGGGKGQQLAPGTQWRP